MATSRGQLMSAILFPAPMVFKYDEELPIVIALMVLCYLYRRIPVQQRQLQRMANQVVYCMGIVTNGQPSLCTAWGLSTSASSLCCPSPDYWGCSSCAPPQGAAAHTIACRALRVCLHTISLKSLPGHGGSDSDLMSMARACQVQHE